MEKKWFKGDLSPVLHDQFNDAFPYVITTMTVPRTYIEALLASPWRAAGSKSDCCGRDQAIKLPQFED